MSNIIKSKRQEKNEKNPSEIESPVKLFQHQKEHVEEIWGAYMRGETSYVDTSRTGLGKTHVALEIAYRLQKLYGLRVGIIGPNWTSLKNDDGWLYWAEKYGIQIEKAFPYHLLQGRLKNRDKDWIHKHDAQHKRDMYRPSPWFRAIAKAGIFLIFDEFHMATRDSNRHYACAALVKACMKYKHRCRIGLLSLTPGDKTEHFPQIVRMAGLVTHTLMRKYDRSSGTYMWTQYGLGEMVRACQKRSEDAVSIDIPDRLSKAYTSRLVGSMYCQYLKSKICFAMPVPENKNKIITRNCYLKCHKPDVKNLETAIQRLCQGVKWDGYTAAEKKEWNLGQINIALKEIERYKLQTIARYIQERSEENPDKKFIVYMGARNTEHISMLESMLRARKVVVPTALKLLLKKARKDPTNPWSKVNKDVLNLILDQVYKPPIDTMTGQTPVEDRVRSLRLFQAKESRSWCFLISPGVGDKSISLHDVHGNHPRELIVIPDYYHSRLTQITGRINRIGVASDVTISIIYCKETSRETNILCSMKRKSQVARSVLANNQQHVFPGEYETWEEE